MNAFAISLDRDARKTRSEAGPCGGHLPSSSRHCDKYRMVIGERADKCRQGTRQGLEPSVYIPSRSPHQVSISLSLPTSSPKVPSLLGLARMGSL